MSKDSTAQAIRDVLGGGERYYGIITDAVYDGLTNISKSIQGTDDHGCHNRNASLCQSLDGIADAINNLSEAIRDSRRSEVEA